MPYYPILIDLEGKDVLVVGGGAVALRKIETLLDHGARVHIIAREMSPPLDTYVKEGRIKGIGREFKESVLQGFFLVIAATNDRQLNQEIGTKAKAKGLLVNAVDQPSDCNFIVPSILRRGDLLVAVSTSGKSPALARKVRKDLERFFGKEYEYLLALMGNIRKEILSRGLSQEENRRIFYELVNAPILEALQKADWKEAADLLARILQREVSPDEVLESIRTE